MTAANPMKGEAPLGEHKLIVNFNGWCSLEAEMNKTVPELLAMLKSGFGFGFCELRKFVQVFLDKPMTEVEVGELIQNLGMVYVSVPDPKEGEPATEPMWVASQALAAAVERFFSAEKEKAQNPPKAG